MFQSLVLNVNKLANQGAQGINGTAGFVSTASKIINKKYSFFTNRVGNLHFFILKSRHQCLFTTVTPFCLYKSDSDLQRWVVITMLCSCYLISNTAWIAYFKAAICYCKPLTNTGLLPVACLQRGHWPPVPRDSHLHDSASISVTPPISLTAEGTAVLNECQTFS